MKDDLTQTEENYLKAIYKANERTKQSANTNAIAKRMNTSAASVTDMMKKLANKNLIVYEKYKGARLSQEGSRRATQLIRKHRLWETFLVEKLNFSWEEVHEVAEELEHIRSEKLIAQLDAFLDYPKYDPHGDPIPSADGKFTLREQQPLSQIKINSTGILVGVKNHEKHFLHYLNGMGISIGTTIQVLQRSSYDNSIKVLIQNSIESLITEVTAQNLLVKEL